MLRGELLVAVAAVCIGANVLQAAAAPMTDAKSAEILATSKGGVDDAFAFIHRQHDVFHEYFYVFDDRDSGGSHFFPSGWMGDFIGLAPPIARGIVTDSFTGSPKRGTTCIRLQYPRQLRGLNWAAIYWQYPDNNWNQPGYNLSRYVFPGERVFVTFHHRGHRGGEWAEFKVGGTEADSFPAVNVRGVEKIVGPAPIRLSRQWKREPIDLTGQDLRSVAGGFCWATNRDQNPFGCTVYVDEVRFEFGPKGTAVRMAEPRFVRSYVPESAGEPDKFFRNACYIYDNSLVVLASCARGTPDDLHRAELICKAFVTAQDHDPLHDGRIRSAYSCGDVLDNSRGDIPRLPGWWEDAQMEWIQDSYAAATDCGNMAWTAIALITFWEAIGEPDNSPYLSAAEKICRWIYDKTYDAAGIGGYTAGVEIVEPSAEFPDGQKKVPWKSCEHNIDIYVAFKRLASATADMRWSERADHAAQFVDRMVDCESGALWTGTLADGTTINTNVRPLDVNPWAMLAFRDPDRFRRGVEWCDDKCRVFGPAPSQPFRGYDFNNDCDGVWWEGTAQMCLAFRMMGDLERAAESLRMIRRDGRSQKHAGAIVAASKDGLSTGFEREDGSDWVYWNRAQTGGATCWYLFAELNWNPYWAEPVSK